MAQYCLLTNLPNRALVAERFAQMLSKAQQKLQRFAIMFIDLDQFKPVNDNYGHAVGDMLLCEVAQRIQHCLRPSDTVGRIGGDEFIVLISNLTEQACEEVLLIGKRICHTLSQPFQIASFTLNISSSIGVAIYPDHGVDEVTLSKNADHAMYQIKQNGRNGVCIFSEPQ